MEDVLESGFDLGPTLEWYRQNAPALRRHLPQSLVEVGKGFQLVNMGGTTVLDIQLVNGLLNLFPPAAVGRSTLTRIELHPPRWFRHDVEQGLAGDPTTTNREEALSPTALVPSMVTHEGDESQWCGFNSVIRLFELPLDIIAPDLALIVRAQGFVHEAVHSVVTPDLYRENALILPDSNVVDALVYLAGFQDLLSTQLPPVSHYASAYMQDGRFKQGDARSEMTALNEVITETITAMMLGFSYRPDGLGLDPLLDRPEHARYLMSYLLAKRVV